MLEARAGLFSRLAHGSSRASPGATWREARLQGPGELHDRRISAFARRYGIGSGLSRQIYEAACAEQVHPALAFGLVKTESGFDAGAVGPTGSIGLTQLQPDTARELSPSVSVGDLYRPRVNLALGFRYLRRQLDRFDDVTLALAAYNGGPSRVETLLASGRHPRGAYARKVLHNVEPASRAAL
ncbi:MAG: lytic transglycosylase domain-containing protein [Gemmatimonadota bacterium]